MDFQPSLASFHGAFRRQGARRTGAQHFDACAGDLT